MSLLYIDKVKDNKEAFQAKVIDIAQRLGIDPNWLMLIFQLESGVNPQAQNMSFPFSNGYATGLLQFSPDTARSLGTSVDAILNMSNVDQLDYVYKYFQPYSGRIKSFEDLYLITFFPAALGYSDNQLIGTSSISPQAVAKSNPTIDLNKDGVITIAEFKKWVQSKIPFGYKSETGRKIMEVVQPITGDNPFVPIVIIILFTALIIILYKQSKS